MSELIRFDEQIDCRVHVDFDKKEKQTQCVLTESLRVSTAALDLDGQTHENT